MADSFSKTIKWQAFCIFLYCLLLIFPLFIKDLIEKIPAKLVPPFYIVVLWAFPLVALSLVENVYARFFVVCWILWFFIGLLNVIASYYYYGSNYLLDVKFSSAIYIIFIFVFVLGIFIYEKLYKLRTGTSRKRYSVIAKETLKPANPIFFALLIAFPFIWFANLYASVGYIPILRALEGLDIVPHIYKLSYGSLYGFALINVLAMLIISDRVNLKSISGLSYLFLLGVFLFFSISTGKRVFIAIFLIAVFVYLYRASRVKLTAVFLILVCLIGIRMGIHVVRIGLDIDKYASFWGRLMILGGDEFRAFVYAVNYLSPGKIENYNWAVSALASGINLKILKFLGYEKSKLVQMGSAYSWKPLFSSEYGIRSGIVSELYMAYGFIGCVFTFFFGFITGWVCKKITQTNSKEALLFLSVIYSLLLISIVGQTTDLVGSLTVLFYAWIINQFIRFILIFLKSTISKKTRDEEIKI